jgi:Domain of unknown function (DUF4232)
VSAHRGAIAASLVTCSLVLAALASAAPRTSVAAAAACTTSGLVVWIDTRGDAAAGSVYYTLKFTNQSGRSCTVTGYPGVSAVDLRGRGLGSPASRTPPQRRAVTLADGATAGAVVQIAQAANFPASTCRPGPAAGLRVYPPNERVSKVVPLPFRACSRNGPLYLHVRAVAKS